MTKDDLEVGQKVWVYDVNARGRGPSRGQITKIGTKLVTIAVLWDSGYLGREEQYRLDSQYWNNKDFSSHHWFKTDDEKLRDEHIHEVDDYLKGIGIRFDSWARCKVDFADRERVADLLKGLGYEPEGKA